MGLLKGLAKGALAKKVYDEARKPQNQQRARDLISKLQTRGQRKPS